MMRWRPLLPGRNWVFRSAGAAALIAVGFASAAAQAEALSRGGAVARALRQNPQVAAARAVELQAEARYGQSRAAAYPSVELVVGVGPSLEAELVPGSAVQSTENIYGDVGLNDVSVVVGSQLQVTQPLYTFGKISERQRAATHEVQARRAQSEMTRAALALSVAELYEGLLLARDARRFFEETEHWLLRTIEDTEREISAEGDLTELDALRLQAALAAARLASNQARTGERQAEAGLVAYLLLPAESTVVPREEGLSLLSVELPSQRQLVELALHSRPELRALSEGSLAYAALGRAEGAGSLPDVFALGFVSAAYTPGRDVVDTRYVQDSLNGFYPGLLLGLRWQVTGDMAARRADEQSSRGAELGALRGWARSGVPAEVVQALSNVNRARLDAEQTERGIQAAKQWLVRASADFSVGLGASREVTDASRAYVELRMASFDAIYRHNIALAALSKATGTFDSRGRGFYPTRGE